APFWFIPFALALGCTVVAKPSEICPLPLHWTVKIMEKVGFPTGVINLVHGGREVSEALISHPDVKGVAFVGSTAVGKQIYKQAGEMGKRALVQAGAKNFVVVMPDAELESCIRALMPSFYGNTGQRCLSGANLVAVGEIYEKLRDKFLEASSKLRLGYGLDEAVEMGPVVTRKSKERILGFIESGLQDGAKLILDGRNVEVKEYPKGYFIGATIFDDVTTDMKIAKEEIFGPVASIIKVKSLSEAVEMINKSNYGNAACIFTSSGRSAREFRTQVKAGNIGINLGIPAPMAFFPFGGWKDSFFGVLHGQIDCVDFFTDKKIVIARW
ncbi:MAG: aldehyde dehydrogenase family protein, partial [Candidatus Bathyarchaeia archaeon]